MSNYTIHMNPWLDNARAIYFTFLGCERAFLKNKSNIFHTVLCLPSKNCFRSAQKRQIFTLESQKNREKRVLLFMKQCLKYRYAGFFP